MLLDQFLKHKALDFKFRSSSDSNDLLEIITDPDEREVLEKKMRLKNVCAKVPLSLVDRLDDTINVLGISKRVFIEYSIIDGLQKADEIIKEVDMYEFVQDHEVKK